jgi:hypothetical protein
MAATLVMGQSAGSARGRRRIKRVDVAQFAKDEDASLAKLYMLMLMESSRQEQSRPRVGRLNVLLAHNHAVTTE